MTEPLLTNDRAHREWNWIVKRAGETAARKAIEALSGGQRPYPLNIARKLGLELPKELADPPAAPPEVARAHLEALRKKLGLRPSR